MSDSKFEPKELKSNSVAVKAFTPKKLTGEVIAPYSEVKKKFGDLSQIDRGAGSAFNLHPSSKKFLGVEQEERNHLEGLVRQEVETRLSELRDSAYQEGFEKGRVEGTARAEELFRQEMKPKHEAFQALLQEFDAIKKDLYAANEAFLVQLVFQVSKQILLKELAQDQNYVKRLLAHVVEKLGAKDNVRVRISRTDFENIESIKEFLKSEIPDLRNIQFEAVDDLPLGGCRVETDLSRINASVENQLQSVENALGDV